MTLEEEQKHLLELIGGLTVTRVFRHRIGEVGIEFADGTRLLVDGRKDGSIELSVTSGTDED
jgi:hypothetical protein